MSYNFIETKNCNTKVLHCVIVICVCRGELNSKNIFTELRIQLYMLSVLKMVFIFCNSTFRKVGKVCQRFHQARS